MVEKGTSFLMGANTVDVTRADGYVPPDGYHGEYVFNTDFVDNTLDGASLAVTSSMEDDGTLPTPPATGGATVRYVMRGQDVDCVPVTYRTWTVTGTPDTTGSQYTGSRCGVTPLTNIVVVLRYTS